MKNSEDKKMKEARKKFIMSLVMLGLAAVYLVSPVDLIPDAIFPAGYLDDLPLLMVAAIYAGYSYLKLKKEQKFDKT
ncbi:MAG TPA: YkvA family protein [Spirochaetota bacterium]|mgnify:CR=1 FL=1|nr:YkvA family protein [Spirochaetota bacterium]HPI90043.1 YkvA family protein [Spirochaetota bacterium]HPR48075.1 YkvA family protein [Spirochaetota bacterium]